MNPESFASWHARREAQARGPRGFVSFVWGDHVDADDQAVPPAPGRWSPLPDGRGLLVRARADDGIRIDGELVDGEASLHWLAADGPTTASFPDGSEGVVFSYDGERFALQIWDAESERARRYGGIAVFDESPAWIVPARIREPETARTMTISHHRDPRPVEVDVAAEIVLTVGEHHYVLQAAESGGHFTAPFRDATSGVSSYGAGRVLSLPLTGDQAVKVGDVALVDLNRVTLLPCAFSPAWNCPLPGEQNVLPLEVSAGERFVTDLEGRPLD